MRAQPAPRLLERVENLVLGDRLIDPSLQYSLRPASRKRDRFIRRKQRHLALFQRALDRQAFERSARDAGDALADHHVEPAPRTGCFVEQVGDSAVPGDRDVEALVVAAPPPCVKLHAPGLDIVEVGDDHPSLGYGRLTVPELPHEGLPRILLVLCGGTPQERDAHLVAQHCRGHAQRRNGVVGKTGRPGNRD
ncbi:hypothetical protein [Amycolatopsis sp. NPDC059657]|uniref:hypothetical protein n=1 Tax=Amycolatopsis sp. NPDC059657 TaxID=3346899 RepID=UPI00367090DC